MYIIFILSGRMKKKEEEIKLLSILSEKKSKRKVRNYGNGIEIDSSSDDDDDDDYRKHK